MTAMLDAAAADPQQIIADLQRKLDARTAELEEKNERYALVSQAVAEGIYDWDIARNALWVSPRLIEIFGWGEPGPDVGARPSQDWNARVHPEDFEHYRAALRGALKGETPRLHCEYRIRLSDGEYRWVEDHALPVRDDRGWAVRLVGAVSDVTDRKRQEQELREALDQQTATAEVLRVISGSATDVQPVFEAITARAATLCAAEFSAVARFEDGLLRLVAVTNLLPDEAKAFHSLFPRQPHRGFVMGRAFVEGRTVHVEDVLADPDYDPRTREILQSLTGYRTFLGVPILRDGKPIGVIGCARRAVKPFTTAQIELVTTFADQAVIAIENARLFDDLRQRTGDLQESLEYQTATSDVLKVISRSTFDLQPVLTTLTETAARLCLAEQAYMTRREGDAYRFVTAGGANPEATANAVRFKVEVLDRRAFVAGRGTITGRVLSEGRAVQITDAAADPEYTLQRTRHGRKDTYDYRGTPDARGRADRHIEPGAATRRAVQRAADRTGSHLRRPGGHRDRERAAARRIAGAHPRPRRIARIPDRDQRRAQGHQPLDHRCPTGAGHSGRNRLAALQQRCRSDHDTRGRSLPLCIDVDQCSGRRVVGRPARNEPLSPAATVRLAGCCSKAGSYMSRTSSPTRTTRCPRL